MKLKYWDYYSSTTDGRGPFVSGPFVSVTDKGGVGVWWTDSVSRRRFVTVMAEDYHGAMRAGRAAERIGSAGELADLVSSVRDWK